MNCIPNHYAAKLSELDLAMAASIPPGGNWQNVPEDIPSQRLVQIRESYARGEGSRSTYYGRLKPHMPSYTINTYFSRPGNGCHLHYDFEGGQHRVLSQREAARLQSFPDSFVFHGSRTSINTQIGNAMPPLLAYSIAREIGAPGFYLDLFSGAGGFALGFEWAGWTSIIANDIDASALTTLNRNLRAEVVCGDIRSPEVEDVLIARCRAIASEHPGAPLWVLGGPPCQGFSTAGKVRSLEDERNLLFKNYIRILEAVRPNGFLFENVTGLINMSGGTVFQLISSELHRRVDHFESWVLSAERYGIPQRRKRLFFVGTVGRPLPAQPRPLCQINDPTDGSLPFLAPATTVADAISDLPSLANGEDGSKKPYQASPMTTYQSFMRGHIDCESFLMVLEKSANISQVGGLEVQRPR